MPDEEAKDGEEKKPKKESTTKRKPKVIKEDVTLEVKAFMGFSSPGRKK